VTEPPDTSVENAIYNDVAIRRDRPKQEWNHDPMNFEDMRPGCWRRSVQQRSTLSGARDECGR
jgi:hypothetical protein